MSENITLNPPQFNDYAISNEQFTKAALALVERINKAYLPGEPVVNLTDSGSIISMEFPGWKMSKYCVGTLHIKIANGAVLVVEQDELEEYNEAYGMDYSNSRYIQLLELFDHLTALVYWSNGNHQGEVNEEPDA